MAQSTTYHFIKASFNITNSVFAESYHQSLSTNSTSDSFKAVVDEAEDTIWIGFESSDYKVGYSQYNLTSFALIGSRYAFSRPYRAHLSGIGISYQIVLIMFSSSGSNYLATVNATTQDMIELHSTRHQYDYDSQNILVSGGYLNVFTYIYGNVYHSQVNSTLERTFFPTYRRSYSNFRETSSYDLSDQARRNYTIINESKTLYNLTTSALSSIEVSENYSYVLYMTEVG